MKILLSTPPMHPYQSYNYKFPRFPILNLTLLAATVHGRHEVRVISHAAHPSRPDLLMETAKEFRPDLVGFALPSPVSAMEFKPAVARLRTKWPHLLIAAGGPFPTFEPHFCLEAGCDAVFSHEADRTFARWIDEGCQERGIIGAGTIATDLDRLPSPAWDLLDFKPEIYTGRKAAALEMSRGCPYGCTFCTVHEFGVRYREKSPGRVLEEMARLWDNGFRELLFVDNSFALNEPSAEALVEGMQQMAWAFEFGAYLRADTIASRPELIGHLARVGLRYAIIGFESYADSSLETMNKALSHDVNIRASGILRRAKIFSIGSHIYGAPGENPSDCKRTYRLGVRHSDLYKAGIFTPLPGSPLYRELTQAGAIRTGDPLAMDYVHYQLGNSQNGKKIQALNLLFFLRYYAGPQRLVCLLSSDYWRQRIFRIEYQTIILRIFSMIRRPFRNRRSQPQYDCL